MLKWIASHLNLAAAVDHPLGSDRALSAYLNELPAADAKRTLRDLNGWLGDPASFIGQMPSSFACRALERLDEFAQPCVARCWEELLAEARDPRQGQPQHAANVLRTYLANSHARNRQMLDLLAAEPPHSHDKTLLARLALRAMRSWMEIKKLGRMTYQAADPSWWMTAHALLRQARELGIAELAQAAFPRQHQASSVWQEYMAGLLLESAPLTNLTAAEIEATDRLVRWIEPHSRFVDVYSPLTPFCIVPAGANAPARWREGAASPPEARFFGIAQGAQELVQLRNTLLHEAGIPESLAATGCTRAQILHLLQLLGAHWSADPPRRRHPRLHAQGSIRVVNGLDMARRMIAASEFAQSGRDLDYDSYLKTWRNRHRDHAVVTAETPPPPPKTPLEVLQLLETAGDQQMMDRWEIIDLSRGGMGTRIPVRRSWQRIGALMAYRIDDELDWHIGVIRRLGSSHGKHNAGLSVFHGTPQCSQIRLASSQQAGVWQQQTKETSGLGWHNAILVSAEERLLLIPSGIFAIDRAVHVSLEGRWRPARLLKLQARGEDYDLVTYQEEAPSPADA